MRLSGSLREEIESNSLDEKQPQSPAAGSGPSPGVTILKRPKIWLGSSFSS
jgi:hypothetical protein